MKVSYIFDHDSTGKQIIYTQIKLSDLPVDLSFLIEKRIPFSILFPRRGAVLNFTQGVFERLILETI